MVPSGLLLTILGIVVIAQVTEGDALGRLGVLQALGID